MKELRAMKPYNIKEDDVPIMCDAVLTAVRLSDSDMLKCLLITDSISRYIPTPEIVSSLMESVAYVDWNNYLTINVLLETELIEYAAVDLVIGAMRSANASKRVIKAIEELIK